MNIEEEQYMTRMGPNENFIEDGKNYYLKNGCLPANLFWEDETGRIGAVNLAAIDMFYDGNMTTQHNLASAIGRVTALRQPEQHRLVRVFFGSEVWMTPKELGEDVDPETTLQDHPLAREVLVFTNATITSKDGHYNLENFIPESFCVDIVRQGSVVDLGPVVPVQSVDPTMILMFVIGWDTTWCKDDEIKTVAHIIDIMIDAYGLKTFELNNKEEKKAAEDFLKGYI